MMFPSAGSIHHIIVLSFSAKKTPRLGRAIRGLRPVSGNFWRTFRAAVHTNSPQNKAKEGLAYTNFPWNSYGPMAPKFLWKFWSTLALVHRVLFFARKRQKRSCLEPLNQRQKGGGGNKEGRKDMRAHANKCRQTLRNASRRRGEDANKVTNTSKREQTSWTNANKRLPPPMREDKSGFFANWALSPAESRGFDNNSGRMDILSTKARTLLLGPLSTEVAGVTHAKKDRVCQKPCFYFSIRMYGLIVWIRDFAQ